MIETVDGSLEHFPKTSELGCLSEYETMLAHESDSDLDARTFAHLFLDLPQHDNSQSVLSSSIQPVLILLRIPLYVFLLSGMEMLLNGAFYHFI